MPSNQIAQRIYDFLKDIPPFLYLDEEALARICTRVEVEYHPPNAIIFKENTQPRNRFYVIREGAVDLLDTNESATESTLVERCGEGEVFGIRPLLAEDKYWLRATAAEETLLYAINSDGIREQLENHPRVTAYLAGVMARGRGARKDGATQPKLNLSDERGIPSSGLMELQSVHRAKEPVTCGPDIPVTEAAEIMTEHDVGSIIIVNAEQHPLGILTDRDIRRNIATGVYGRKRAIREVMTQPVVCISPDVLVAEIQIAMVKYDIHHLVVTEDGTNKSPITGVISEHDLLVLQGNNPAVLIREIGRAKTATYVKELRIRAEKLLRQYLEHEVSISFITTIMTEINDVITTRCIELSIKELRKLGLGSPPAAFAWISLGSQGRGEQLLRTDQDSGLVFADQVDDKTTTKVKGYFIELASQVTKKLFQVGYDYCTGNMMASNPQWCLPVNAWKDVFSTWMKSPRSEHMLNVSIFFDYRCIYGEQSLTDELTAHVFEEVDNTAMFQAFLARAALQNPAPLTFFRNFMVEKSGEHKDQFDLKARAMMPLTDAARVLILGAKQGGVNNTIKRYQRLAELEPQNAELYQNASEAYEILIRLRALIGLRRGDNGRYIKPAELSRLQRVLLRNTFHPVGEIQRLLELRYQLNLLR